MTVTARTPRARARKTAPASRRYRGGTSSGPGEKSIPSSSGSQMRLPLRPLTAVAANATVKNDSNAMRMVEPKSIELNGTVWVRLTHWSLAAATTSTTQPNCLGGPSATTPRWAAVLHQDSRAQDRASGCLRRHFAANENQVSRRREETPRYRQRCQLRFDASPGLRKRT